MTNIHNKNQPIHSVMLGMGAPREQTVKDTSRDSRVDVFDSLEEEKLGWKKRGGREQMKGGGTDQRGARHKEARSWPVARDGQIIQRFLP